MTDVVRVQYSERQFLGAGDFRAEQDYHRDARRRHAIGPHTWGIVVGLDLVEVPVTGAATQVDVVLQPGLAIDGYGRELVAFAPVRLDPAAFEAFVDDAHRQVWLAYDEDPFSRSVDAYADCEPGRDTRIGESFRLVVDPQPPTHDEVLVDGVPGSAPPTPAGAPALPVDESVPYQELPAAEAARWLVRLGDVRWDGAARVFRPATAGRLTNGRRYAGLVADHLLGTTGTVRVAPRAPAADPDAADFAAIEGRLRVKGRINAERELWMEGAPVRFTYAGGSQENVELTLGRSRPTGAGHQLRVRLGDAADANNRFVVGRQTGAASTDVFEVDANNVAHLRTGTLDFGHDTRQMIDLWSDGGHQYGLGIQPGTLYYRTAGDVAWFRGGAHDQAALNPGAGGILQMRLDTDGRLHFGTTVRQMLNLWGTQYGIGVQSSTLYARSDSDFCWFRGGVHAGGAGDPGGGSLVMRLDAASRLTVFGTAATTGGITVGTNSDAVLTTRHVMGKQAGNDGLDNLYLNYNNGHAVVVGSPSGVPSDLLISGQLRAYGDVRSVVNVWTIVQAVGNQGPGLVTWQVTIPAGEFTQVDTAFAALQGFSIFDNHQNPNFTTGGHLISPNAIPQHVYVRVTNFNTGQVNGISYCSESKAADEGKNTVLFTVVVIGRRIT